MLNKKKCQFYVLRKISNGLEQWTHDQDFKQTHSFTHSLERNHDAIIAMHWIITFDSI